MTTCETPIISTKSSRLEFSSLKAFGTARACLQSPYPDLEIPALPDRVSKRASSTSKGLLQTSHGTVLKKSLAMQPLNSGPLGRVGIGELRVRRLFRELREVCGSICALALNVHDRRENESGVIRESTARNSSINASERASAYNHRRLCIGITWRSIPKK